MNNNLAFRFSILVEGDTACFRRPEFASDLVTYDIMPPLVASRMLSACLPAFQTRVRRVRVLNDIVRTWRSVTTTRGVKRCQVLQDVAYVLEAEVIGASTPPHRSDIDIMLGKGDVHLGLSDFRARISLLSGDMWPSAWDGSGAIDLGWMLHDLKQSKGSRPRFVRVTMVDGIVDLLAAGPADFAT